MTAYYNEHDAFAAQWLRNLIAAGHIAPGDVDERSIADVRADDVRGYVQCHFFAGIGVWSYALRLAGWPDDRPAWTGSCPCQPFSDAGAKLGTADERHLWPEFFRLIRECRPPVVLGEQVASKAALGWLDAVFDDLEGAGYACGAADTCAAGVGAPHIRQRLYWVAEPERGGGREGRAGEESGRTAVEPHRHGSACGLGDSRGTRGGRDAGAVPGAQAEGEGERGQARRVADQLVVAGPALFWADAVWLPCQDGKSRPVEPKFIAISDGDSGRMGPVGSNGYEVQAEKVNAYPSETGPGKVLRRVQEADAPSEVQRGIGIEPELSETEILRPEVHGPRADARGGDELEPHTSQGALDGEGSLRDLREGEEAPRSPQGRESIQQRDREFADFVHLLPSSFALAKLSGDAATAEALLALLQASGAEKLVQHPSYEVEAIWRSLAQETKDRFRLGFEQGRFVRSFELPLAHGASARVGRLRAYGNACCAPAAAEFVRAVMER